MCLFTVPNALDEPVDACVGGTRGGMGAVSHPWRWDLLATSNTFFMSPSTAPRALWDCRRS